MGISAWSIAAVLALSTASRPVEAALGPRVHLGGQSFATAKPPSRLATLHWNAVARTLVARNRIDPLWSVRTYALLSIAQHDAIAAVEMRFGSGVNVPSAAEAVEDAAIAAASATVLNRVLPGELPYLSDALQAHKDALLSDGASAEAVSEGAEIGRRAAKRVMQLREDDGADNLFAVSPLPGPSAWSANPRSNTHYALRPLWGSVRPFFLSRSSQFRPVSPPPRGSAEFERALRAVRTTSQSRTREQVQTARYWDDGGGTATPPGHWNSLAAEIIVQRGLTNRESARVLALLNIAMMDASIACWEAKYTYWLLRPSQADTSIRTVISVPNFPSYPSGHAAFSGAASEVLARLFPDDSARVRALADEAAQSRVFAGLHYPFDSTAGLIQGREIAQLVLTQFQVRYPLVDQLR